LRISEPKDKIPAALSFFEADKTIASTAIRYKIKQENYINRLILNLTSCNGSPEPAICIIRSTKFWLPKIALPVSNGPCNKTAKTEIVRTRD